MDGVRWNTFIEKGSHPFCQVRERKKKGTQWVQVEYSGRERALFFFRCL
jgi:hypothetical protein